MKITTEKTGHMLVRAWDSRGSGTDFAIIDITDRLLTNIRCAQEAREFFKGKSTGAHFIMDGGECQFFEIEKLNEGLFKFIEEATKDRHWDYMFIDDELCEAIEQTSLIDDIDCPKLRVEGDDLMFQLFAEGGSEGYYLEFCTDSLPVEIFL